MKKILSFLVIFTMVVSLSGVTPAGALAQEQNTTETIITEVVEIQGTEEKVEESIENTEENPCEVGPATEENENCNEEEKGQGTITIVKFVDGKKATADATNGKSFPMNVSTIEGFTFTLEAGDNYEVSTIKDKGTPFGVFENTETGLVGNGECGENNLYRLAGYTTASSYLEAAQATLSSEAPEFIVDGDIFVIVWNEKCPEPPLQCEAEREGSWADDVVSSNQGNRKDGSQVLPGRSDTQQTLGPSDWNPGGSDGFFSLGFGGEIVLSFDSFVPDVSGTDFEIYEATNGSYPLEEANVEVSQNGSDWQLAGVANNSSDSKVTEIDLSGTGLTWIKSIRITDTSDPGIFQNDADGFDLDAVRVTKQVCDKPEDPDKEKTALITVEKVTEGQDGTFKFEGLTDEGFELTTLDGFASETFEVPADDYTPYTITEIVPENWNLTSVICEYDGEEDGTEVENGKTVYVDAGDEITCTFINTIKDDGGGSKNPPGITSGSRSNSGIGGEGEVLGEAIEICTLNINTYMRKGYANNVDEVKTLQNFLNTFLHAGLTVDGNFGPLTENAVKNFQLARKDNILSPWGITEPTGIFYKTTLVEAKNMLCPVTVLPIPTDLVPWSKNPNQTPPKMRS